MKKRLLSILLCLCMVGTLLPYVSIPATAAETVSYIDADGREKTAQALPITSESNILTSGWYYVSGEVTITPTAATDHTSLVARGSVHLILKDGCTLNINAGSSIYAGVEVPYGYWLSIYGQSEGENAGKLVASSTGRGAAIGSRYGYDGGTVNIYGGNIIASSTDFSAAIGAGNLGGISKINIAGGRVKATSTGAAAIGGGGKSIGGAISITGGTVEATGLSAGIGGAGSEVTISGGTVTAISTDSGAGIGGGGGFAAAGGIKISGGTVIARSASGAGIGSGSGSSNSAVHITGGTVTAESKQGAGIGGGTLGDGGIVYISGGTVTARSTGHDTYAFGGAGIGGGVSGSGAAVIITGGSVVAESKFSEAIGRGSDGLHSGSLTNGTASVALTTVTLSGISGETAVRSFSGFPYYGTNGMKPDAEGRFFLYLPHGTVITDADTEERSYRGSVSAGGTGILYPTARLSHVAAPADGAYQAGDKLEFEVTFSSAVTVTGTPYIPLTVGGTANQAVYAAGSGTATLVFRYNVQSGELDTDGIEVGDQFQLNGGSIKASGIDAHLASVHIGHLPGVVVRTDSPAVTISSASKSPTSYPYIEVEIAFTESVTGFIDDDINVAGGRVMLLSGSGSRYTAFISITHNSEGAVTIDIPANAATDLRGNGNTASNRLSFTYDSVQPQIAAATPVNGAANVPVSGAFVIRFNEAMNGDSAPFVDLQSPGSWFPTRLSGSWSNGNRTYTIPYGTLLYRQTYSLTISPYSFSDQAGNSVSGGSQCINFTTETEPLVPTVSPKNLTIAVGETANVSVALGQGSSGATEATITAGGSKLSVTPASLTATGSVAITGLAVGTTEVVVRFNDSAHTQETISVTVHAEAPVWAAGSALTVADVTQSTATLTWTAASDAAAVVGYKLYRDGVLIGFTNGTALSYTVTGLVPSTAYSFQVQAGNLHDVWSTGGPAVSVTTDSPAPLDSGGSSDVSPIEASVSTGGGTAERIPVTIRGGSTLAELTSAHSKLLTKGHSITVSMPETDGGTTYSLSLPVSGLSGDGEGAVTMLTSIGNAILPSDMLTGTAAASGGKVTFSISRIDPDQLPDNVLRAIGARPAVSLSLSVDGKLLDWNNHNAPVVVSIPYTPSHDEDPNAIILWYVDSDGSLTCVTNGRYVPETRAVSFTTTHFSQYVIGYHAVDFADVSDSAWYRDAVTYLAARKITSGTSDTTFHPNGTLTRGQFITLLMRAYGIEADDAPVDNFADAGNTYYTGYLAAAKRLGISSGVGGNYFAPQRPITRQDMSTLLYKFLTVFGRLSENDSGKTPGDFSDQEAVAPYAQEAMAYLVKAGVLSGSNGLLSPKADITRAQTAQVLYRLLSAV